MPPPTTTTSTWFGKEPRKRGAEPARGAEKMLAPGHEHRCEAAAPPRLQCREAVAAGLDALAEHPGL